MRLLDTKNDNEFNPYLQVEKDQYDSGLKSGFVLGCGIGCLAGMTVTMIVFFFI